MKKLLALCLIVMAPIVLSGNVTAQDKRKGDDLFPKSSNDEWMSASYNETYREGSEPQKITDYLTTFGADENMIRNRLGDPQKLYVEQLPNRHEAGKTNTEVTLKYEGLVIQLLSAQQKTFVTDLYIDNCQLDSAFQHYLCQPVPKIINRLGQPTVTSENELIYTIQYGDMGNIPLRIGIEGNQTRWIYVRNYIN